MTLNQHAQMLLPAVEEELKSVVSESNIGADRSLYDMLCYHMGWNGEDGVEKAPGKRIRPLLLLLSTMACEGDWQLSLPAAAAVELIHNFSLIHDDIEDNSEYRRGRLTLWKQHRVPLALNAGDSMFTLAFIALQRFSPIINERAVISTYQILSHTCLALTIGQHLDISFENEAKVTTDRYIEMIQGKTASLLAGATQIGAILAGADDETIGNFRQLGFNLGIAFQIQDDYLGIWGDAAVTGKSAASDLIARKKSLPILYGLQQNQAFSQAWNSEEITEKNAPGLAEILAAEGALGYTQTLAEHYTQLARGVFDSLPVRNQAVSALEELTGQLLNRAA